MQSVSIFVQWVPIMLLWYGVFTVIGISFLPLTSLLFQSFKTRGYEFTKPLGLALLGIVVFWLSSLFSLPIYATAVVGLIIGTCISWGFFIRFRSRIRLPSLRHVFFIEAGYLASFMLWAFIRGHEPSLASLEKYMDLGFVVSIVRNNIIPATDMWYSSVGNKTFPINYYYFGHFLTALLSQLSTLTPSIAYNLMLATIASTLMVTSFSLGMHLYLFLFPHEKVRYAIVAGIISSYIINFGANLHTLYIFTRSYPDDAPVPFWKLWSPFAPDPYWYPKATRFIPFTIHEFPSYSHVVADLHGHLINTLHIMLIIGLLLVLVVEKKDTLRTYLIMGIVALLLGISYMTNTTDFFVYSALTFTALTIRFKKIIPVLSQFLLIVGAAILVTYPFSRSFIPFASGIGINCPPSFINSTLSFITTDHDKCQLSPPWMLAILWGFFWFISALFLGFVFFKNTFKASKVRYFVFFMVTLSLFLTIAAEFVYFRDIYPTHFRANTMFKLGYQAYIMFGLVTGPMLVLLVRKFITTRSLWYIPLTALAAIMVLFVGVYPAFSIPSYYSGSFKSLDGAQWITERYPDHAAVIAYLKENDPGSKNILEAHGDSYTDYNMVSVYTGIPTVIGWPVHEWLWRGSYDAVSPRAQDVQKIYEVTNKTQSEVRRLLRKYNIRYVVISPQFEMKKYPSLSLSQWYILGKPVFEKNGTYIFELP